MDDRIEQQRLEAKERRKSLDLTLRLLLRYLPLTVFLTFASIYILYQYTLDPTNYLAGSIFEPHAQRIYSLLIGFNVMCWGCIVYYFKGEGRLKKFCAVILLLSAMPLIYELVFYFDLTSLVFMFIAFHWLHFAFKPHEN